MSKLVANSLSSERSAGCVFAENFRNAQEVVLNGATINGTPTINFGAELDGTNDYITYATSEEFNNPLLSFVIEFIPDFASDSDINAYFFQTNGAKNYVLKRDNANSNTLLIRLGATTIVEIAEATYTGSWNQDARNVFLITADATNNLTNAWLNGTQILTNDATAWTQTEDGAMAIGATTGGAGPFDGTINSLKIFNKLLTAQDAQNYSDNNQFDYRNRTVIDLPMGAAQHDPTNNRTLDIAGISLNSMNDGDMEAVGVTSWGVGSSAIITKETTDPKEGTRNLKIRHGGVGNPFANQNVVVTGQKYRITGWFRGDGSATPRIINTSTVVSGTNSTAWQWFDTTFTGDGQALKFYALTATDNFTEYDDIKLTLLPDFAGATLGAGDGGASTPNKLATHGYSFDGGDYLTGTATGLFNSAKISIVIEFYPDFATDDNAHHYLYDTTNGARYSLTKFNDNKLRITMGDTLIVEVANVTFTPYWKQYQKNILIITSDSANNLTNAWLNGNQILTNDSTAWTLTNPANYWVGTYYATNSLFFDGKITGFQVYPFLLTPMQVADIQIKSDHRENKV